MTRQTRQPAVTLKVYQYRARIVRVVDGDTVICDVDQGFDTWRVNQSFRLLGLNAREHDDPGGQEAKQHLETLLPAGSYVTLSSVKDDKFGGRFDAVLQLDDGARINDLLVQSEWAAAWDGTGTKPVPPWPRPSRTSQEKPPDDHQSNQAAQQAPGRTP